MNLHFFALFKFQNNNVFNLKFDMNEISIFTTKEFKLVNILEIILYIKTQLKKLSMNITRISKEKIFECIYTFNYPLFK